MRGKHRQAFIHRRAFIAGVATLTAGGLARPGIVRAQTKEIVIGGAASHKPWVEAHVMPMFEKWVFRGICG